MQLFQVKDKPLKAIKYALYGLIGLVVLAIAGAAVFALTFDPNRYKDQIERLAQEKTGRTLKLSGDLAVAFWPSLGANVGGVTLSEKASDAQFLALESAHASVALMPLLRGEVIVDGVRVSGLKAQVVKDKNGRFNFQDLLGEDKPKAVPEKKESSGGQTVAFDIASVTVEKSAVSYRDLATGQALELSDFNLSTGRIAEKADGKVKLSAHVKGNQPALDLKVDLASGYKVDLPAKSYALSGLDAKVSGKQGKDTIEAKLAAPSLLVSADSAKGEAVTAEFRLKGETRSAEAVMKLAGLQGSAKALVVPQFSADIAVTDPGLPMKSIKVPLSGSLRADLEKQTAEADIKAKIDESNLQAKIGLAKFSPPAYRFDVNIDQLNLDRYFPPEKAAAAGSSKESPGKAADTPVDLSALKGLDASGKLQVGALQARGLKMAKVNAELRAANGRAELAPHSAELYGGSVSGAIALQADGNRVAVKEKLTGISIGPLLRDFAQQDRLEGKGNVALDVTSTGASVNAMKKALAGTARVDLRDGAIKGINVAQVLRKAKTALSGGEKSEAANQAEQTDFSEMSASFTIKNGVAHNEDLEVKSPLVRVTGKGDIDIGNSKIDYVTKAAVVATTQGQGGADLAELKGLTVPVHLSGTFDNLSYKVNYGAVAADLAKSRAGEKIKERVGSQKEKLEEKLGGKLKDLLKR
jgi:AsmA protein